MRDISFERSFKSIKLKNMKEELKEKIIKLVKEEKMPLKELAGKVFISERQLKLLLKNWGVVLPNKREYRRVPMPKREELMRSYQKYETTEKVAIEFKTSTGTINRWMKALKIPTRRMKKMTESAKVNFLEAHLEKLGDIDL